MRKINQNIFFSLVNLEGKKCLCQLKQKRKSPFFSFVKGYTNKKVPFAIICSMHHKIKSPTVHNELNWISIPAEEQSNFCVFPPSTQCGKVKSLLSLENLSWKSNSHMSDYLLFRQEIDFTELLQKLLHRVWKSTTKRDHTQKFPWNQLFSNLFSKTVDLTEKSWFFRKISDRVFDDCVLSIAIWGSWFHEIIARKCDSKIFQFSHCTVCPFCQKSGSPSLKILTSLLSKAYFCNAFPSSLNSSCYLPNLYKVYVEYFYHHRLHVLFAR